MGKLNDKYEDEIILLDGQGLKPIEIQQRLIENHPDAEDVPSIATIYRIRNNPIEGKGNKYVREHYRAVTWDFQDFNAEFERFIQDCMRYCQPEHRKELNDSVKAFRKEFHDIFNAYESKAKETEQWIMDWDNEIKDGICDKCKSFVLDKTHEILNK